MRDLHNPIKNKNVRTLRDTNPGGQRAHSDVQLRHDDLYCLTAAPPQDRRQYLKVH